MRFKAVVMSNDNAPFNYAVRPYVIIIAKLCVGMNNCGFMNEVAHQKTISILCLTLNRSELAKEVISKNLERCKAPYELLICDQGSTDSGFLDFLKSLKPAYFRQNLHNEGVARALNQLIIRSNGDFLLTMADDILLPDNWGQVAIDYASNIENTGILGFEGQDLKHPEFIITGKDGIGRPVCMAPKEMRLGLEGTQVFGNILLPRSTISIIGCFHEGYHPYGLEDSDFCFRAILSNLLVYYIPGLRSQHLGVGETVGETHKANKQFAYYSNLGYHRFRAANYHRLGLYEPLPIPKGPMV